MEKSASKSLRIFPVVAWLLLTTTVLLSATSIQSVNAGVTWDWDNSTVGSTVVDDQEFLVDSQFGNVLAVPPRGRSITYPVLGPKEICRRAVYYNHCIQRFGRDPKDRECGFANHCGRQSPQ